MQVITEEALHIHFSDFFDISPEVLQAYGAFNISLINDLPLFVDPFLLFNSKKPEYQRLHADIIKYVRFLRDKSIRGGIGGGLLKAWYVFREVKQTWLGYSEVGNSGSGLGNDFAIALNDNLNTIFSNFGQEQITQASHIEKLGLIAPGVGRDNISDFTTNLIKEYLLDYTQTFAYKYVRPELRKVVSVDKVRFNYETETWERDWYDLPTYNGDFVLLTPKDMLTKDEIWINRGDLLNDYNEIAQSIPNDQLRDQVNNYFNAVLLPDRETKPTQKEKYEAVLRVLRKYPEVIEYYIRYKEDTGDLAVAASSEKVAETQTLFIEQVHSFVQNQLASTQFYRPTGNTFTEARERLFFLKDQIEHNDGYRIFYLKGKPIKREQDLQILYRLVWFATPYDVNREVNNGRGPVDFKISDGSKDKTLVEFKLASNSQLQRNLANQVAIYERANSTQQSLKAICYFSQEELEKVQRILRDLQLENNPNIVLIDARADNKPSASIA